MLSNMVEIWSSADSGMYKNKLRFVVYIFPSRAIDWNSSEKSYSAALSPKTYLCDPFLVGFFVA
jgi:hypothetical protein